MIIQKNNCQMICINGQLICPKVWKNAWERAEENFKKIK